jgi:hypothetical protein
LRQINILGKYIFKYFEGIHTDFFQGELREENILFNRKVLMIGFVLAILIFTHTVSAVKPETLKAQGSGTFSFYDEATGIRQSVTYTSSVKQLDNQYNGKGTFTVHSLTVGAPTNINVFATAKADYVRIEGDTAIFGGFITETNDPDLIGHYLGVYIVDNNPDRVASLSGPDKDNIISRLTPDWFAFAGVSIVKGNIKIS